MNRTHAAPGRHRFSPGRPRPARLAADWQLEHGDLRVVETRAARRARLEATR